MAIVKAKTQSHELGVEAIVASLIHTFSPERIYLFGSRARGDAKESSDYDFMIIVGDDTPDSVMTQPFGGGKIHGEHVNVDVKVWRKTRFERQLHLKSTMPSIILREGILLYGRNDGAAADVKAKREDGALSGIRAPRLNMNGDAADPTYQASSSAPAVKKRANNWPPALKHRSSDTTRQVHEGTTGDYDPVIVEITSEWLRKARTDLRMADFAVDDKSPDFQGQSLFHSQQAIEKVLKAFLAWHDFAPAKMHDLEQLSLDCIKLDETLNEVLKPAPALSRWSIDGRYPNERVPPSPGEAGDALHSACTIFDAIVQRIPKSISSPFRRRKAHG